MNLNAESAYEPYSNQGLFHEMEHGRGGRPSDADSAQLLKKRKKPVQGSPRIIEGLQLLLRVLQLLLGLSILALMLHAAIVWRMTRYKIMDRGSDWIIYQWPHTDMRPTWTMMGIAVGTTLAHIGSLMKCTMNHDSISPTFFVEWKGMMYTIVFDCLQPAGDRKAKKGHCVSIGI
ncbi:hypothetical protein CDV31_009061 [Fusarium ambrosium]|uniref:Uncharacterized protein n=1 Tax=Fusarium ambrosium TaxID=131363 RepID=A0A428TX87_9HYPO|nr:hypothetical protein CDV31_009061 [Fusarium ambrosium]